MQDICVRSNELSKPFPQKYLKKICFETMNSSLYNEEIQTNRRLIADLCLLYKIINNLISLDLIKVGDNIHSATYTSTIGHQFQLKPDFCSIDSTKYFFTNRVIKIWNSLQERRFIDNIQSIHLPHQWTRSYSLSFVQMTCHTSHKKFLVCLPLSR